MGLGWVVYFVVVCSVRWCCLGLWGVLGLFRGLVATIARPWVGHLALVVVFVCLWFYAVLCYFYRL